MLELLIVILIVFWFLGLGFNFGGDIIHVLLIIALIMIIYRLFQGR